MFYVVGIQAAAQPSTVFLVDGSLRVDLTIPSLTAPTGIPAAPSTSACTVTRALSAPTPHRDGRLYAYGNTDGALCTDSRADSRDDCVGPRGSGGGAGRADCTGCASQTRYYLSIVRQQAAEHYPSPLDSLALCKRECRVGDLPFDELRANGNLKLRQ